MPDLLTTRASPVPRISFGIIVLNGEPFTRYNLRSLYPWAHQIIVVEGACRAAAAVADDKGHSTDGTLDVLRRFKVEEDPEKKLMIVTAEDEGHPDGFWPGEKHEMSQAFAKRATGNYIWQVDVDEFYREEDVPTIVALLKTGITQISFPFIQFWGGIGFRENGEWLSVHFSHVHRLFAWGPGYHYITHRPPTVVDENGIDLRQQKPITAQEMKSRKIFMYHYCMIFPKQVVEKCEYYSNVDWTKCQTMNEWATKAFFKLELPYNVHNSQQCTLAWLDRWKGGHPAQIHNMVRAVAHGGHPGVVLRATDDIEKLLASRKYMAGRIFVKKYVQWLLVWNPLKRRILFWVAQITPRFIKDAYWKHIMHRSNISR
jgi:hypothetical protein